MTEVEKARRKWELIELLEDPDWGLELKKEVREKLRRSFAAEERGERGIKAEDLAKRLSLITRR